MCYIIYYVIYSLSHQVHVLYNILCNIFSLTYRDGALYVASLNCVWRLTSLSVKMQITELIGNKEFELALLLSVSSYILQ